VAPGSLHTGERQRWGAAPAAASAPERWLGIPLPEAAMLKEPLPGVGLVFLVVTPEKPLGKPFRHCLLKKIRVWRGIKHDSAASDLLIPLNPTMEKNLYLSSISACGFSFTIPCNWS